MYDTGPRNRLAQRVLTRLAMPRNEAAAACAQHDATTYQLLNCIEHLAARARGGDAANSAALRLLRAQLAEHFADYQLFADDADVDFPPRDWIRHAMFKVDVDSLPTLVRLIRLEIADRRGSAA